MGSSAHLFGGLSTSYRAEEVATAVEIGAAALSGSCQLREAMLDRKEREQNDSCHNGLLARRMGYFSNRIKGEELPGRRSIGFSSFQDRVM